MVDRRPILRNLVIAAVLLALVGMVAFAVAVDRASAVAAKPGWKVTSVGKAALIDYPQLDGDYVAYRGPSQSEDELLLYQISTGTTVRIDAPSTGGIAYVQKDGRYVAWITSAGVWVYDIATGGPARLVSPTTGGDLCLSGDRLAWRGNGDIHVFNIPLNAEHTLGHRAEAGLSLAGDYLVWQERVLKTGQLGDFMDPDIMLHDLSSGKTENICAFQGLQTFPNDNEPQVAANGFVVWTHYFYPGFSEIWGYPHPSMPGVAFAPSGGLKQRPVSSPLTDGRWVVWNDRKDLWLLDTQVQAPDLYNDARLIVGTGDGKGGAGGGVWYDDKALGGGWLVYYMHPNIWRYDLSTGAREIVANVAPEEIWNLQTDGQRIVGTVGIDSAQHDPHVVQLFEQGSSTTTTTTVASTGFLPNPNGYQFANLAYKDANAAKAVLTHLFGASLFDTQGAQQSLSPSGKQAYVDLAGKYAGGICMGFASSSIAFFERHLLTENITPGVKTVWDLGTFGVTQSDPSKLPANLKWILEEYYTAQLSTAVHDTMFDSAHYVAGATDTAGKLKTLVQAIDTSVSAEPVILCVWGMINGREGGHAVVAYDVESAPDGNSGKIWIYDSNYPGVPHSVSYDLKSPASWSYPELFSEATKIAYVPLSLVTSVVDSSTTVPFYPGWVYTNTACNIAFSDSAGRVTGKTSSGYVADNPQVRLEPMLDGGLGQATVDRYVVTPGAVRQFTLEQVGSQAAYASAHGTDGSYLVCSTGDSGDSISVTAPYAGTDVRFVTEADTEVFIGAENGEVWATASFEQDLYGAGQIQATSSTDSEGRLAVVGSSEVVVERHGEEVSSVSVGDATNAYILPSLPSAERVSIDASSYNVSDGTLAVRIDANGDGTYERTDRVETTTQPGGKSFWDVPASHPYHDAIQGMAGLGVIDGYDDSSFGPSNPVTRQQFAKMIVKSLGLPVSEANVCSFGDVVKGGPPTLYPDNYVAVCAAYGITQGKTPSTFAPYANMSRAQLITMVVRAAKNAGMVLDPPDAAYSGWGIFHDYNDPDHGANVRLAEFNGLLTHLQGSGTPAAWTYQPATRGEVAQVLWNLMLNLPDSYNPL